MKRISLLCMLIILSSCGKSVSEIFSAPKTQDTAGLIASCTTKAQAVSLSETHGLSYRVINEKRGLVEYYGVSQKDLALLLPKSKIRKNIVYERQLISSDTVTALNIGDVQFYGPHNPEYRNSSAGRYFPHLEQISGLVLSGNQGAGVTIAIIDTGVYYNHPHLSPNIATNEQDKHGDNGNSQDDDNNGYTDDYTGWDFYNGDAYPIDDNGHGTHVAGLAAGTFGGVAPKAKILPVKVLSGGGRGDLATIAAGILYAIDMGADIINLSLGGPGAGSAGSDLQSLLSSVSFARDEGALIIAAAGNGGDDGVGDCNDQNPIYPANIDSDNIISVASVDEFNKITSYSNFGRETVDVAAPGGSSTNGGLLSTGIPFCNGPCAQSAQTYANSTGTSMATPVVSGLAALIISNNQSLDHIDVRNIITSRGTTFNELESYVKSGQVINVENSLN